MCKGILLSVSALVLLSGCVAANRVAPIDALRHGVMEDVNRYSNTFEDFMKSGKSDAEGLAAAKAQVASSLKDQDSAKFRNVVIRPYGYGRVVCGEVNAKNSYGGYVGFTRFVASNEESAIEDNSSQYQAINEASNAGLYAACGR